jgi:hypothetical protein
MPSGIQGGIGQHGYADKFEPIQNTSVNIAAPAPSARLTTAIDVKSEFIRLISAEGSDGVVGTDHIAHRAAHTLIGRIGFLANTVV